MEKWLDEQEAEAILGEQRAQAAASHTPAHEVSKQDTPASTQDQPQQNAHDSAAQPAATAPPLAEGPLSSISPNKSTIHKPIFTHNRPKDKNRKNSRSKSAA